MSEQTKSTSHPLDGNWVTEDEDSDVTFTISINNGQPHVSGRCISDGEEFEIADVVWDGEALSFSASMPSSDFRSKNVFRLTDEGYAELELTTYEAWKKK